MTKRKFTEGFAHLLKVTNLAVDIRQMFNHHLVRAGTGVLRMVSQFQKSSNFVY